jgi:hypothetical protein
LVFIRKDSVITTDKFEKDHLLKERRRKFIKKVFDWHLTKRWHSKDSLSFEVASALARQIRDDDSNVDRAKGGTEAVDLLTGSSTGIADVADLWYALRERVRKIYTRVLTLPFTRYNYLFDPNSEMAIFPSKQFANISTVW